MHTMRILIHGATSLYPVAANGSEWQIVDIATCGSTIEDILPSRGNRRQNGAIHFDASGLLVLPGIVDIHGDAFERQIQPRPETVFGHDIALTDTDRQLAANGITTACHGLTFSWEGGLRGHASALDLLGQLAQQRDNFHVDHRVHLRFENHHVDGVDAALEWIRQGWISFLAFNDHLPTIAEKIQRPEKLTAYAERSRCDSATFKSRLEGALRRSAEIDDAIAALASECRRQRIPMASHDDETHADRSRYQAQGVTISEFPRRHEALQAAHDFGNQVVMGAPNVLLGGSHCGGLSTSEAVRKGLCHILASDYYYPSLLHAPFKLAYQEQACSLAQAWRLVSETPAQVLGLRDRGRIAESRRADLLLVEVSLRGEARLVATVAAGKLAYCSEMARIASAPSIPLAA